MQLIPVPTTPEYVSKSFPHWFPFLQHIAKRSKETVENLVGQVARIEIQPVLIWDETKGQAVALLGIAYHRRGNDLIAELKWATGRDMKRWTPLLGELERYLKHVGCVEIRPLCRPGWSRMLKRHGYRITHYQMEKVL